jgi:hypothetical protein
MVLYHLKACGMELEALVDLVRQLLPFAIGKLFQELCF